MKALFIGFIFIQLAIDLAHSVTAFPFVHYGMFSESFSQPDSLSVFEITADGQRLNPANFAVYRWDQVQNPLYAIEKQTATHDFAFDKAAMTAGLSRAGAGALAQKLTCADASGDQNARPDSSYDIQGGPLDNPSGLSQRFPSWYKAYLGRLLGHPIQTLHVDKAWYRYTDGKMILLKKETCING